MVNTPQAVLPVFSGSDIGVQRAERTVYVLVSDLQNGCCSAHLPL